MKKIKLLSSTYFFLLCLGVILVFAGLGFFANILGSSGSFYAMSVFMGLSRTAVVVCVVAVFFVAFALLSMGYYAVRSESSFEESSEKSFEDRTSKVAKNKTVFFYIALFTTLISGSFLHVFCAAFAAEMEGLSRNLYGLMSYAYGGGGDLYKTDILYLYIHLAFAAVSSIFFLLAAKSLIKEKLYRKNINEEA